MAGTATARGLVTALVCGALLALGGACKQEGAAPPVAPDTAAPPPPEATRPAPAEDPAAALQALFDALKTNDRAAIEAVLISSDECLAVTKDAARCQGVAARRKAFLDHFGRTPLPEEAHLVNIMLLKTVELSAEDQNLTRAVKIQPGSVKFKVGEAVTTLRNVAAIEVEGGWRVLPGKPIAAQPPETPGAGAAPDSAASPGAAPGAAAAQDPGVPGSVPPSAASGAPAPDPVPPEPKPPAR